MWNTPSKQATKSDHGDRAKPDFLILGAQKSGTTSLFAWMAEHPEIEPASTKEIHYFNRNFDEGEDWYRSHFPRTVDLHAKNAITGEATPVYLFHPKCPERAYALNPDARLIVILRDPARRAYSQFQHMRRVGQLTGDFRSAMDLERPWLNQPFGQVPFRPNLLRRGLYADQIERWCGPFPRAQMRVLIAEEMFREPARHLAEVVEFLGRTPVDTAAIVAKSGAKNQRGYSALDDETMAILRDLYREPNQRLAEVLGRDPGWKT